MFVRLTTDLVENVGSAVFANIEVLTLLTMPPDIVHHATAHGAQGFDVTGVGVV